MMTLTTQGMGMAVGDGRHTSFWCHGWVDDTALFAKAIQAIPEDHLLKKVCDYWHPQAGWDWNQLASFLPAHVLQRIASFELDTEEVGDQLVWLAGNTGKFTIASAIKLIRLPDETIVEDWTWAWKLRLPQRIKLFLWLLLHGRILTNAERFRRHMSSSPFCSICLGEVEDLAHVFCGCLEAQEVWSALQRIGLIVPVAAQSFTQWL